MKTKYNVKLLDVNRQEVTYSGIETITLPDADSTGVKKFTAGDPLDNVPITPDFSGGDQTIDASEGYVMRSAVIQKPANAEQAIGKGKTLAGIEGEYVTPGTTKEITPDFSGGDQAVQAEGDERWDAVTVKKPETLLPENIAKDVEIAGVTGTYAGTSDLIIENDDISEDIIFYDFDGTIVARYTLEQAAALTALPTPPAHEGFTFQEWNHTLSEVTSTTHALDVGANYITTDGKTVMVVGMSNTGGVSASGTVKLNFYQSQSAGVSISVDGKTAQTVSGTGNVSLSLPGWSMSPTAADKTITFTPADGVTFYFSSFTGITSGYYTLTPQVKNIAVGAGYTFGAALSSGFYSNIPVGLTSVKLQNQLRSKCCVVPRAVTSITFDPSAQDTTRVLSLPRNAGITANEIYSSIERFIYPDAAASCTSSLKCAKYVCFPDNATSVTVSGSRLQKIRLPTGAFTLNRVSADQLTRFTVPARATVNLNSNYLFNNCYNLREVVWENCTLTNTTATDEVFYYCYKLQKLTFPLGITAISGGLGYGCYGLEAIVLPEGVTSPSISFASYGAKQSLQIIVYPSTVTSSTSITDMPNLRAIVYLSETVFNMYGFGYKYDNWNVYVRDELVDGFKATISVEENKAKLKPLSSLPVNLSDLING